MQGLGASLGPVCFCEQREFATDGRVGTRMEEVRNVVRVG
jgi:hypothetical protein